jgi:hypothetical protein
VAAAVDSAAAAPAVAIAWHRTPTVRDDALAAALALRGLTDGGPAGAGASVRIVRDGVDTADTKWARAAGHVLVDWPASGAPGGWGARARPDTAGAVVAGAAALVAPLARAFAPRGETLRAARVAARWPDGEPAATERAEGAGCVRAVAVPVPQTGDVALSASFSRLVAALTRPCGASEGLHDTRPDSALATQFAGRGPLLAARALLADAPAQGAAARDRLPAWLLGAALALLLLELPLRRATRERTATPSAAAPRDATARAA